MRQKAYQDQNGLASWGDARSDRGPTFGTQILNRAKQASRVVSLFALVNLAGCAFSEDALWPSITGEAPKRAATEATSEEAAAILDTQDVARYRQLGPLALGTGSYQPPQSSLAAAGDSSNAVLIGLRDDLGNLQQRLRQADAQLQSQRTLAQQLAESYRTLTLQLRDLLAEDIPLPRPGPTATWVHAQGQLQQLNGTLAGFGRLRGDLTATRVSLASMSESAQLASAVEATSAEDRTVIEDLRNDMTRTDQVAGRMSVAINSDVAVIRRFLLQARNNQAAFLEAESVSGEQLLERAYGGAGLAAAATANAQRKPVAVIRLEEAGPGYQTALSDAVSAVLAQRPQANFDLLFIEPSSLSGISGLGRLPQISAEDVLQALADLGLPPERINLAAVQSAYAQGDEIHLFVR